MASWNTSVSNNCIINANIEMVFEEKNIMLDHRIMQHIFKIYHTPDMLKLEVVQWTRYDEGGKLYGNRPLVNRNMLQMLKKIRDTMSLKICIETMANNVDSMTNKGMIMIRHTSTEVKEEVFIGMLGVEGASWKLLPANNRLQWQNTWT